jgi:hypothetical protein
MDMAKDTNTDVLVIAIGSTTVDCVVGSRTTTDLVNLVALASVVLAGVVEFANRDESVGFMQHRTFGGNLKQ